MVKAEVNIRLGLEENRVKVTLQRWQYWANARIIIQDE